MPYESFKCSHHVSIRGLVQDRQTGSWRYLVQVRRIMQDETSTSFTLYEDSEPSAEDLHGLTPSPTFARSTSSTSLSRAARWQRRSSSSFAAVSPRASQIYSIRRSFSEFKLLHAAMKSIMGDDSRHKLPDLPSESIFAFFVGETQTMLQKKRLALENILIAIENHSAASDSSEYLAFLAKTNTYNPVKKAPASPSAATIESSYSVVSPTSCAVTSASSSSSSESTTTLKSRRSFRFGKAANKMHNHSPILERPHSHQKRRRRQSVANENPNNAANTENQVNFVRYSLV
uniref:PX domain-containing protein n=1 Tax=Globisporangium ultimum (strain ATCC 200006 / CBS 805.95 / DAOM BR144) TaxID=431595 RepID=K3WIP3_GLOUD